MKKLIIFAFGLLSLSNSYAYNIRVVSECSGIEKQGDLICCFYLDHMIYIDGNYVGCFQSTTGTCCPSENGISNVTGELTLEQIQEIMQTEEFQNSANEAMEICTLTQFGKMGTADIYPNPPTNGSFTVKFNATASGNYKIVIVNLAGQEVYRSVINAQLGINEISINYLTWTSTTPNHYLIRIIGADQGYMSTVRIF